jgi:hypothetical protein
VTNGGRYNMFDKEFTLKHDSTGIKFGVKTKYFGSSPFLSLILYFIAEFLVCSNLYFITA